VPSWSGRKSLLKVRRLRFESDALEREFRAELAERSRRPTRWTFLVVMIMYAMWAYVDVQLFPRHLATMWTIRAIVLLLLGCSVALTFRPSYARTREWIVGAASAATAGGLLAMTLIAPEEVAPSFYTGIGITIFGAATLFLLRLLPVVVIALVILVAYVTGSLLVGIDSDLLVMSSFFLGTVAILGPFAAFTIERFARRSFLDRRALEEERARSERLLLNVLPAPVAERLKRDPAPIADRHPEASVLFADICDFTTLSSTLEPEALVRLLNRVFTEFDHVVARYGLEKIKTIGDAYMAVAGVPVPVPDHLERVADAAIAMREVVAGLPQDDVPLRVRIGIDTGPVVAGVIGEAKFIYDLWGDPVTTASRMESHGVAGAIQVTERVYERLNRRYAFQPRGEIDVKGKGRMSAWLLDGLAER
jgi:class 3 adenylate cyclase